MSKKFTDKQTHILDVAEELIAKKGFEGTSVRDISSKAGINVAMISYYFGSKEKMMTALYQYRVQKTRDSFAEFTETIRGGRPEMQMKEIIKFIISLLFRYSYFHGFVKQEIRHTEYLKDDLDIFYQVAVEKLDNVVKLGIASGVFTYAPRAEDILTPVIGTALFAIRNKTFYEKYLPSNRNFLKESEKKIFSNVLHMVFAYLGYQPVEE